MSNETVALKLPTFWTTCPSASFAQTEAQFALHGITADETKYPLLPEAIRAPLANSSHNSDYRALAKKADNLYNSLTPTGTVCTTVQQPMRSRRTDINRPPQTGASGPHQTGPAATTSAAWTSSNVAGAALCH
ncbi:retrovirus-related Pol polyprotein [Elysia marginata]|uniref:Retrovirus-related Pol polyprotein n=1 Tax=Elysia marginata TaxID=1093978 RepID=A0AAV4GV02_9GAST|nr:retrovirus-related Pol polyprotein [Elysia marginata]